MASDVEQISSTEYDEQRRKKLMKLTQTPRKKSSRNRKRVIEITDSEDEAEVVLVPESERSPPPKATVIAHISPICLDDDDDKTAAEEDIIEVSFEPADDAENLDEVFLLRYQHDFVVAMHSNNNVKFICHACDSTLSNEDRLKQHLKSRLHQNRLANLKQNLVQPSSHLSRLPQYIKNVGMAPQVWECVACNCNGLTGRNEVMAHLRNDIHRRNTAFARQKTESLQQPDVAKNSDVTTDIPSTSNELASQPAETSVPDTTVTPDPIPLIQDHEDTISDDNCHSDGLLGIKIVSCESLREEVVQNFSCRACNVIITYKSTWEFHLKSLTHRRNVELLASQALQPTPTMLVRNTSPRIDTPPQPFSSNVQSTQPIHLPCTIVDQDPADDTSSGAGDSVANSIVLDEPASESSAPVAMDESTCSSLTSSRADDDDSTVSVSDEEFRTHRVRRKYKRRGSRSDSLSDTTVCRPKRRCAEAAQNRIKDMAFLSRLGSKQLTNYHRMMEKTLKGEDPSTVASEASSSPNSTPLLHNTSIVKKEKPEKSVPRILGVQTISDDEHEEVGQPADASDIALLQAAYSTGSQSPPPITP